jgi:hypothetical protein
MTYLVQNVSGKIQSQPKRLSHVASSEAINNWAIGQIDTVDDDVITYYQGHTDAFTVLSGPQLFQVPHQKYNTNAATAAATLAAADVTGGDELVVLNMTGTLTGAANAQLPTVAAVVAADPNIVIGGSYVLEVYNGGAGAFAWTVTTNTGWTLTGTMTVAQGTTRRFLVTFTSLTAAVLQSLGTLTVGAI